MLIVIQKGQPIPMGGVVHAGNLNSTIRILRIGINYEG